MLWEPLLWLLLLVIVDFITGLIGHTMREGFSSSKVREGLAHKFTYVIALVLCLILEKIMEYYDLPMVYAGVLYSLTYVWIVITETGSILENLVLINPDMADNSFMRIFDRREPRPTRSRSPFPGSNSTKRRPANATGNRCELP